MTNRRFLALIGTILALIIAIGATSASAQEPDDDPGSGNEEVPSFPFPGKFGRGGFFGLPEDLTPKDELLADALSISVEDLQAAREEAHAAALAELVEGGYLTQEQADLMAARQALKGYIDPDALMAEALGISLADLQAAREEGTSLPALLEELGLTYAEFAQAKQDAYESAVQQAVDDNVLTQEQADQILSGAGFGGPGFRGPGGFGRHGGPGGFGGNGGFRGFGPFSGDTAPAGLNI
jgi:hypothetical protein